MPGVTKETTLEMVRGSCEEVFATQTCVHVNQEGVERFIAELDPEMVKFAAVGPAFPLRFQSLEVEITSIALWNLFKFGSGYDPLLLQKYQKKSTDIMQFGVLSMMLASRPLDVHFMKAFSMMEVQGFFNLDPSEDQEVSPGITMSRQGPLAPLCRMICEAMNSCGRSLEGMGQKNLGEFVLATLDDLKASGKPPQANILVQELCDCFPVFQDFGLYEGQKVTFSRKAQLLASDLYCVLSGRDDRFNFVDIEEIAIDSGNIVLAYLRETGVLNVKDDTRDSIEAGTVLEQGNEERALRAATVAIGFELSRRSAGAFSARELGFYIQYLAQEKGELKDVTPHITRGTMAY